MVGVRPILQTQGSFGLMQWANTVRAEGAAVRQGTLRYTELEGGGGTLMSM